MNIRRRYVREKNTDKDCGFVGLDHKTFCIDAGS